MLLLASAAAVPQQAVTRYTVEIVVFRYAGTAGAFAGSVPAETDEDVEITPVPSRKLAGAANRLKSNGMKILAHTAWTQSPLACEGKVCRESFRGASATQLGLAKAGIIGEVSLQRGGRFLHLGVDLTVEDGGRRYRIQEVRQVKADQAQYFDHPGIGVLALVTAAPADPAGNTKP